MAFPFVTNCQVYVKYLSLFKKYFPHKLQTPDSRDPIRNWFLLLKITLTREHQLQFRVVSHPLSQFDSYDPCFYFSTRFLCASVLVVVFVLPIAAIGEPELEDDVDTAVPLTSASDWTSTSGGRTQNKHEGLKLFFSYQGSTYLRLL